MYSFIYEKEIKVDKWKTLEHNGPIFPKEYEYVGFDKKLSSLAEEMLYHYSAKLETDYIHNQSLYKNLGTIENELPKEYHRSKLEDFSIPKRFFIQSK